MHIALHDILTKNSIPNITIPEPYQPNRFSVLLHFLVGLIRTGIKFEPYPLDKFL
jgi:hypothetical protein